MGEEVAGGRLEDFGDDPLKAYPRVMHPHRYSSVARRYLRDQRLAEVLRLLMGEEPVGVQSMSYFKPPGARGQKMHQDQFYLQVSPGTCMAAWVALDRCDAENGAMMVAPGTRDLRIDCRNLGAAGSYVEGGTSIPVPRGFRTLIVEMEPGDVLFFNGSLIHGSGRNRSSDRWRRSFICHYAPKSCRSIAAFYHPLVTMEGEDVEREVTHGGGPCGEKVDAVDPALAST